MPKPTITLNDLLGYFGQVAAPRDEAERFLKEIADLYFQTTMENGEYCNTLQFDQRTACIDDIIVNARTVVPGFEEFARMYCPMLAEIIPIFEAVSEFLSMPVDRIVSVIDSIKAQQ